MNRMRDPWSRVLAAAVSVALVLIVAAPPAGAAETTPAAKPTLAAAASARAAQIKLAAAPQAPADTTSNQDRGFFRSKKGVVAVVLALGVLTWTAVSRSKDAVHSPAR